MFARHDAKRTIMKKGTLLFSAATILVLASCDKKNNDVQGVEPSNTQDLNFALEESYANRLEVATGRVATVRGNNAGVRSFGQMLITEHSAAQAHLQTAASSSRLAISYDSTGFMAITALMGALQGRAFDSTFLTLQILAHQQTLTRLQNQVTAGQSRSLKSYATMQIPVVQRHLQLADSLRRNL